MQHRLGWRGRSSITRSAQEMATKDTPHFTYTQAYACAVRAWLLDVPPLTPFTAGHTFCVMMHPHHDQPERLFLAAESYSQRSVSVDDDWETRTDQRPLVFLCSRFWRAGFPWWL